MAFMSAGYHTGTDTKAHTSHQEGSAVLVLEATNTFPSIAIFGPASAKDKFEQIAALFNEALNTEGKL